MPRMSSKASDLASALKAKACWEALILDSRLASQMQASCHWSKVSRSTQKMCREHSKCESISCAILLGGGSAAVPMASTALMYKPAPILGEEHAQAGYDILHITRKVLKYAGSSARFVAADSAGEHGLMKSSFQDDIDLEDLKGHTFQRGSH